MTTRTKPSSVNGFSACPLLAKTLNIDMKFLCYLLILLGSLIAPLTSLASPTQPIVILTTFSQHSISELVEQYQQRFPDTEIRVMFRRTRSALRLLGKNNDQNIDIIISSSPVLFSRLSHNKQLYAMTSPTKIPDWLTPHILDISGEVNAFGYSGFGLMANQQYLDSHKLPMPTSWEALTSATYYHHIAMSTPSRSGTTNLMVENILQHYGWDQGWKLLMRLGGNIAFISSRSFGVSEAISKGFIGIAPVIDSYAINSQKVFPYIRFNYLPNSILMPAYIGIARRSHALDHAQQFVGFLLSDPGQRLLEHSSMAKFSLNQPALAQNHTFTLNKQLVHSRDPLISHLFDQAITNQLHELNAIWERIHHIETSNTKLGTADRAALAAAKHAVTAIPVTAEQARSDAYLAMFHSDRARNGRDPMVAAEIQRWKLAFNTNLLESKQQLNNITLGN